MILKKITPRQQNKIMKKIETLFWDWNGTLLDDVKECLEIINVSLKKRELKELSIEDYLEMFEFPVKNYYEKIGFDFSRESFEEAGQEYIDAYGKIMFDCALQSGAVQALETAKGRGLSQFILSALNHSALEMCVKKFGLVDYFTSVRGLSDSYAHRKIELGIHLLAESGCKTSSALMIGDTVHDYETACAMGIKCVLVASGHNSVARLEKCGVPVFKDLKEFSEALKQEDLNIFA